MTTYYAYYILNASDVLQKVYETTSVSASLSSPWVSGRAIFGSTFGPIAGPEDVDFAVLDGNIYTRSVIYEGNRPNLASVGGYIEGGYYDVLHHFSLTDGTFIQENLITGTRYTELGDPVPPVPIGNVYGVQIFLDQENHVYAIDLTDGLTVQTAAVFSAPAGWTTNFDTFDLIPNRAVFGSLNLRNIQKRRTPPTPRGNPPILTIVPPSLTDANSPGNSTMGGSMAVTDSFFDGRRNG